MSFVTIIQRNVHNPLVYHGVLVNKNDCHCEVAVVNQEGIREQWTCHFDFWNLIE